MGFVANENEGGRQPIYLQQPFTKEQHEEFQKVADAQAAARAEPPAVTAIYLLILLALVLAGLALIRHHWPAMKGGMIYMAGRAYKAKKSIGRQIRESSER